MTDFKCRICGCVERDTIVDYCLPLSTLMRDKMETIESSNGFLLGKL